MTLSSHQLSVDHEALTMNGWGPRYAEICEAGRTSPLLPNPMLTQD